MRTSKAVWISMMVAAMLPASAQDLTNVDRETFLRNANIVSRKELSRGVTASSKAELNDGTLNHAAHIQVVDIAQSQFQGSRGVELNFRDSYKYNVAAYELSKLIGLNMIPPSVERRVAGHGAAVTWWVDRVAMVELDRQKRKLQAPDQTDWNRQMHNVRAFDELIRNTDRNQGNLVITTDWQIWMIDHTRAFRMHKDCANLKSLRQIDRKLLANLRHLSRQSLVDHLGAFLSTSEIAGLLARKEAIVKYFDQQIVARGEGAVLYDTPYVIRMGNTEPPLIATAAAAPASN